MRPDRGSQAVLRDQMSHELVFGVVGHIGSGASQVAKQLREALAERDFAVHVLKARDVIVDWATSNQKHAPPESSRRTTGHLTALQDLGDEMRRTADDHAVVARLLVRKVRAARAQDMSVSPAPQEAVHPDGKARAFILDSIRHPAEVELLRHVYRSAFVLVGVVCEEDERKRRITTKFVDAGAGHAQSLMDRDAKAAEKWGQRVSDAFYLADVFLDNTAATHVDARPNKYWDVPDQLVRLLELLTRSRVVRPTAHEAAMYIAHGARMKSACLSRQVGAALVDREGNVIATGTNEVPRAGGGVYGTSLATPGDEEPPDHRCAFTDLHDEKYCSNTREQGEIVSELVASLAHLLKDATPETSEGVKQVLRSSRIGGLLEFSRAVHAEMDAILSATRSGSVTVGTRLYVTTFPCHYCARHIVAAGVDEVQYIEPYPKSRALKLHADAISTTMPDWKPPSRGGDKVVMRPFTGIAPRLYERVFSKELDLKDASGSMKIGEFAWGDPWKLHRVSYAQLEAELALEVEQKAQQGEGQS